MKKFAAVTSTLLLSAVAFTANATVIQVGGVEFDSNSNSGIEGQFKFQQWYSTTGYGVGADGQQTITSNTASGLGVGALTGVGAIDSLNLNRTLANNVTNDLINSALFPSYCFDATSGCGLTFAFGGLTVDYANSTAGQFVFDTTNAFLNIYLQTPVDSAVYGNMTGNLNTLYNEVQQGTLWASFKFDVAVLNGSNINGVGGKFEAFLSVTGGLSDVVTALDKHDGLSDFYLNSSAFFTGAYSQQGNGQFNTIPEPASLAMLGLGLLGLAGVSRRRKAA